MKEVERTLLTPTNRHWNRVQPGFPTTTLAHMSGSGWRAHKSCVVIGCVDLNWLPGSRDSQWEQLFVTCRAQLGSQNSTLPRVRLETNKTFFFKESCEQFVKTADCKQQTDTPQTWMHLCWHHNGSRQMDWIFLLPKMFFTGHHAGDQWRGRPTPRELRWLMNEQVLWPGDNCVKSWVVLRARYQAIHLHLYLYLFVKPSLWRVIGDWPRVKGWTLVLQASHVTTPNPASLLSLFHQIPWIIGLDWLGYGVVPVYH